MRVQVVVAPDSFKGSASAAAIAGAVAAGWSQVRPDDRVLRCPMSDGGEGTVDILAAAAPGAVRVPVDVRGPDDRTVSADHLLFPGGRAVIEMAAACGLALTDLTRPLRTHSRGLGQLMPAALDAGATELLVAVGGSASTDGGAGVLAELGARFLGPGGRTIGDGGGALAELTEVDAEDLRPLPAGGVRVLCDVRSPLLGPTGAARMFSPQKGASPDDVKLLEQGLTRFAHVLGGDPAHPGAGAAGGVGFGLRWWGAELVPGAAGVADAVGLAAMVADADVVITGEGRFDGQSHLGKVPSFVRELAGRHGRPTWLVAGSIAAEPRGFARTVALSHLAGSAAASMADPITVARLAGARLAEAATVDAGR